MRIRQGLSGEDQVRIRQRLGGEGQVRIRQGLGGNSQVRTRQGLGGNSQVGVRHQLRLLLTWFSIRPFRALNPVSLAPTWRRVTELSKDVVYHQGNMQEFINMTGWSGDRVLYFGDHVYTDLAVCSLLSSFHPPSPFILPLSIPSPPSFSPSPSPPLIL